MIFSTEQQILDDYPELESNDFRAVYEFSAKLGRTCGSVKLLFDENLSRQLVVCLPECVPSSRLTLSSSTCSKAQDGEIWEFAKTRDFVIVSTDSDFYELATTVGPPPQSCIAPELGALDEGC